IHERRYYYPWTGLLREYRDQISPSTHKWANLGELHAEDRADLVMIGSVGLAGWRIGDRSQILDFYGLSDPLLSRLPCIQKPEWRVGHYQRRIPEGYVESLVFDENRLGDPGLAAYYALIR